MTTGVDGVSVASVRASRSKQTTVARHQILEDLLQLAHPADGILLVHRHEPAVTGYVCGDDRFNLALHETTSPVTIGAKRGYIVRPADVDPKSASTSMCPRDRASQQVRDGSRPQSSSNFSL
jgi:hypothetical protein